MFKPLPRDPSNIRTLSVKTMVYPYNSNDDDDDDDDDNNNNKIIIKTLFKGEAWLALHPFFPGVLKNEVTVLYEKKKKKKKKFLNVQGNCSEPSCGGTIYDVNGIVSYPDFNNTRHYDDNTDCCWQIISNEASRIEISFLFMDIEWSDGCLWDYLEVRTDQC